MTAQATEPQFVTATTPAGIEVRFSWAPKRIYKVRGPGTRWYHEGNSGVAEDEWREVPSVTTVLGVLDKPALPWWGMKTGVAGLLMLVRDHGVRIGTIDPAVPIEGYVDQVVNLLTEHKLTVNHVRDAAGSRGVAVHDALELWAKTGDLPDTGMFPPEEQGYVAGLCRFLRDVDPEPLEAEVLVGSLEHGYAGRYDLRIRVPKKCKVVYKRTPKKGDHYAELAPGPLLTDLKTSSGVYPSHSMQLEAYEAASVECGYEPTKARGVLHVTADGFYEFVRSTATAQDFLCVLSVYTALEDMKRRKR